MVPPKIGRWKPALGPEPVPVQEEILPLAQADARRQWVAVAMRDTTIVRSHPGPCLMGSRSPFLLRRTAKPTSAWPKLRLETNQGRSSPGGGVVHVLA